MVLLQSSWSLDLSREPPSRSWMLLYQLYHSVKLWNFCALSSQSRMSLLSLARANVGISPAKPHLLPQAWSYIYSIAHHCALMHINKTGNWIYGPVYLKLLPLFSEQRSSLARTHTEWSDYTFSIENFNTRVFLRRLAICSCILCWLAD